MLQPCSLPPAPFAGLDEAILGEGGGGNDPEADTKRIASLLKHGAHSLVKSEEAGGTGAGATFQSENIDEVCKTVRLFLGAHIAMRCVEGVCDDARYALLGG